MKLLYALTLALLISSCAEDKHYTIDGAIYGGGNFEGEMVYLVPFFKSENGRADSALVKNGRFHFEGKADDSEVYVIRFRPMMELFMDKLIVVKEEGHVRTTLNRPSTAIGTPLNDSLQTWREYHAEINMQLKALTKKMRKASAEEAREIAQKIDSIKQAFEKHNRAIVERNNNAYGAYVDKVDALRNN